MRVMITSQGDHDPVGMHLVMVEDRCMLLDLSSVDGTLHDASITQLEWSQLQDGRTVRDGGFITRADGSKTPIFDKQAVLPYVTLFEAEWARLHEIHEASTAEAVAADEARASAEAVAAAKGQAELKAAEDAHAVAEAQAHLDVIAKEEAWNAKRQAAIEAAAAQDAADKLAQEQATAEAIAAHKAGAAASKAALDAAFEAQQAANAARVHAAGSPSPTGNPNV